MTIKQHGGIFGRNPTFNDVDVDGTLSVGGTALPTPSNIAKLDTAQEFTQEQEIKVSDITAYDATAADAQVTVGPTLFLNNPTNSNTTVAGQVVFGLRSTPYYARLGATGGSIPKIFVGIGTSEIARFTSDGITFNGDTAAANALDDYEEGEYIVTVTPSTSGTVTLNTGFDTGMYVKVGNLVTVSAFIAISSVSSPVGNFGINLPITPAALTDRAADGAASIALTNVVAANVSDFVATINENDPTIYVQLGDANTLQNDSAQELQANTYITFTATYRSA